jgi:glucose-1-phosphate thymidylyltransferase
VILGDNLFFGSELSQKVSLAMQQTKTSVFVYTVKDPRRFGVIGFDNNGLPNSIEEKPSDPQSNFAITGLYFFNYQFFEDFRKIEPSSRGEYEITDILKARMKDSDLDVNFLRRGYSWVDAGTFESMFLASRYVELHQSIQGYKIASPEEIAIRNNWTSLDRLIASSRYPKDFLHNLKNYL